MITVNKYFDKIFVINLKERPEKLNDCTKLLNKLNIEFEVYEALNCILGVPEDYPEKPLVGFLTNKPGAFGCLISHLEVVKIAKERGYKKILVLEDGIHERAYEGILKRNEGPKGIPIDQFYRAYQNIYPCYVMRPNLIWQKAGFSDIAHGCFRNYESFMKEIE